MRRHPFEEWEQAKRRLNACLRGHFVRYENQDWYVVCFATPDEAEAFKAQFGGVNFDHADRGKGANWFRWKRPAKEPPLGGRQP